MVNELASFCSKILELPCEERLSFVQEHYPVLTSDLFLIQLLDSHQFRLVSLLLEIGVQSPLSFLFECVKRGYTDFVRMSCNSTSWSLDEGHSLLMAAVLNKRPEIVNILLQNGAVIDPMPQRPYRTILHHATNLMDYQSIEMLLAYGADVNKKDENNVAPISIAVSFGSIQITLLMLQHGAVIPPKTLRAAVALGQLEICILLEKWGGNVYELDEMGRGLKSYISTNRTKEINCFLDSTIQREEHARFFRLVYPKIPIPRKI